MNNDMANWMGNYYDDMKVIATYNLIYNASLMVLDGTGYALTLDKLTNTDCNSDLCFKPLEPTLQARLVIVWKKYQVFSKASEYFLQQLLKTYK